MNREGTDVAINVLLVEDDAVTQHFFAESIRACPALHLAASVGSVALARAWLDAHAAQTDVLLTDLGLPDGNGVELIRYALLRNPACDPLVVSMFGDEDSVLTSIEAGALGYIQKDALPGDIAQSILELRCGASPISPMIARRVLAKFRGSAHHLVSSTLTSTLEIQTKQLAADAVPVLTPTEHEVLNLIARGYTYGEIATLRGVTVHTVQTHIKGLYRKLAVHSRSEAVFEATRIGML